MRLGDTPSTGGTCPGSPGCFGYVDPAVNAAIQAAVKSQADEQAAAAAAAQQQAQNNTSLDWMECPDGSTVPKSVGCGEWIPGISNSTVMIAGGIVAAAVLLGGRRA